VSDAGYVRSYDEVYNSTPNAQVVAWNLATNLDPASSGNAYATSSGGGPLHVGDVWAVSTLTDGPGPGIVTVLGGPGASAVPTRVRGLDGALHFVDFRYLVRVPSHESRAILTFLGQRTDPSDAAVLGQSLAALGAGALDGLTPWQTQRIVNFAAPDPLVFVPETPLAPGAPPNSVPLRLDAAHLAPGSYEGVLQLGYSFPNGAKVVPLSIEVTGTPVGVGDSGSRLALAGLVPNPARVLGAPRIAYTLASDAPATITLYDVRGRVIARRALARPAPGPGSIALEGTPRGIVWIRLAQGGQSVTRKGILLP
jgi:hypothetical protein